jgi:hypothetical protein
MPSTLIRAPHAFALALLLAIPAIPAIPAISVIPEAQADADTLLTIQTHSELPAMVGNSVRPDDRKVTLWVGPNRVRRDDGRAASIVLFDKKKLYIVDHEDKSYTAIDLPVDFTKLVPGPQGELMKKEMSSAAKLDVKITRTNETKKIGKWNARKYHVEMQNPETKMITDMWASKDVGVDMEALRQMQLNMAALQPGSLSWVKKMQQIEGFPVLQDSTLNFGTPRDAKTHEELISVETKEPPAGTFAPPAGYTQKPFANPGGQVPAPAPAAKKPGTRR